MGRCVLDSGIPGKSSFSPPPRSDEFPVSSSALHPELFERRCGFMFAFGSVALGEKLGRMLIPSFDMNVLRAPGVNVARCSASASSETTSSRILQTSVPPALHHIVPDRGREIPWFVPVEGVGLEYIIERLREFQNEVDS